MTTTAPRRCEHDWKYGEHVSEMKICRKCGIWGKNLTAIEKQMLENAVMSERRRLKAEVMNAIEQYRNYIWEHKDSTASDIKIADIVIADIKEKLAALFGDEEEADF